MAAPAELVRLSSEVARVAGEVASRLANPLLSSQSRTRLARAQVLVTLSAQLQEIAYDLQGSESVGRLISQKRLYKFLRRLEAVCTVGSTVAIKGKTLIWYKVAEKIRYLTLRPGQIERTHAAF